MYSGYVTLAAHWLQMEVVAQEKLKAGGNEEAEFYQVRVRCTLYAVRCTLHAARCTLYAVRCHCTLYIVCCTLHAVCCTLYAARYATECIPVTFSADATHIQCV